MKKEKLLLDLLNIVNNVCQDGIVSQKEVGKLQDWVDENAVEFIGEEYNRLIFPLQSFLDNGEFCSDEQRELLNIINTLINKNA